MENSPVPGHLLVTLALRVATILALLWDLPGKNPGCGCPPALWGAHGLQAGYSRMQQPRSASLVQLLSKMGGSTNVCLMTRGAEMTTMQELNLQSTSFLIFFLFFFLIPLKPKFLIREVHVSASLLPGRAGDCRQLQD